MSLSRRSLLALLGTLPLASRLFAEPIEAASAEPRPMPPLPPLTLIPLYPGAAPGSEHWTQQEVMETTPDRIIRNVTHPALMAYLPAKPNGTAVIIAPGGGFYFLSMDNEGFDMTRKLLDAGFTVFILKYRLIATGPGWHPELDRRLHTPGWEKSLEDEIGSYVLADAQTAIRTVRARASEFAINPARIGIIGFSAGGYVATRATVEHTPDSRPDFAGCVYGVKPPNLSAHVPDLPPLFMVWADDDDLVFPETNALPLYQLWKREGVPVEFHLFAKGQHGFGTFTFGRPSDHWLSMFMDWMNSQQTFAGKRP